MINFYLLHYKTRHFTYQIENIKKFIKDPEFKIYVTIDSDNLTDYQEMKKNAAEVAEIIEMPFPRLTQQPLGQWGLPSAEYGLAANYVYKNHIKDSNTISVMMENDVFFIKDFYVEDYCKNYDICGNVRSNYNYLPERHHHFWPGFIIFNDNFSDKELFGLRHMEINNHIGDSGAESFYWLEKNKDKVRHVKFFGEHQNYSPFESIKNEGRCMTIDDLPDFLKKDYLESYEATLFDDFLIHLEGLGKYNYNDKLNWFISNISKYK
jgi:hypothetical protein